MRVRTNKKLLTVLEIENLKPAPAGTRYDRWDTEVSGFGVRVTDRGSKSYILSAKFPGDTKTTRRTIGSTDNISLAAARKIAIQWLGLVVSGRDPKDVQAEAEQAKTKSKADKAASSKTCIAVIAAKYFGELHQKKSAGIESTITRYFVSQWADRQIASIKRDEVSDIISKIKGRAPEMARAAFYHVRDFFNWAESYGYIEHAPTARIKASRLLPPPVRRERSLTDVELAKVWNGSFAVKYPLGPMIRMLILTGCRRNEVGEAPWREFDLKKKCWTIPASRMKCKVEHVIPLTPQMIDLLKFLPRKGDFVFSYNGRKPVAMSGHSKYEIDRAARVWKWRIHDLRRTMRSALEREELYVRSEVAEAMIAHGKKGMIKVYNQHQYLNEKAEGFTIWNDFVEANAGTPSKMRLAA